MDRKPTILNRMPDNWNKSSNSVISTIVSAITSELAYIDDTIDYNDNLIGVNTTTGGELDDRWGALLNIPRRKNESDNIYRSRLKTAIISLAGGTAGALRYAVSVALNVENNIQDVINKIQVMDAWVYTGPNSANMDKSAGNAVVYIDSSVADYIDDLILENIRTAVMSAKAAGINVYIIWVKYETDSADVVSNSTDEDTVISIKLYNSDGTVTDIEETIIGMDEVILDTVSEPISEESTSVGSEIGINRDQSVTVSTTCLTNSTFMTNHKDGYDIIRNNDGSIIIM